MSVSTCTPVGPGVSPAPTIRIELPLPRGDADATRQLAAALAGAADDVRTAQCSAVGAIDEIQDWRGVGALLAREVAGGITSTCTSVAVELDGAVRELNALASRLDQAHHHHHWSLLRLAALGAAIAVTGGTAVAVIAATEAGAAAVAAATAAASAAVEAASAAATAVGETLTAVRAALAALQPLRAFLVLHATSAAVNGGASAGMQLVTRHRINWLVVAENAGYGAIGSISGSGAQRLAGRLAWAAGRERWLGPLVGWMVGGTANLAASTAVTRRAPSAGSIWQSWIGAPRGVPKLDEWTASLRRLAATSAGRASGAVIRNPAATLPAALGAATALTPAC